MEALHLRYEHDRTPSFPVDKLSDLSTLYKGTKKQSNLMARLIVDFGRWMPACHFDRINVMGRPIGVTATTINPMGGIAQRGGIRWAPGGMRSGISDIVGSIRGLKVNIEIKVKDSQRDTQKEWQRDVEGSGEIYGIVRTFSQFLEMFTAIFGKEEFYAHMRELRNTAIVKEVMYAE